MTIKDLKTRLTNFVMCKILKLKAYKMYNGSNCYIILYTNTPLYPLGGERRLKKHLNWWESEMEFEAVEN